MRDSEIGGIAAKSMSVDRILAQLSSLKDNSQSFASEPDDDHQIWQDDVTALEAAISIIAVLQDEGIGDAEAVKDLIFDYRLANKQNKEYHRKFDTAARAIPKDGAWHCPECNHRVQPRHSHCHWCGKKLGGW